MKFLTFMSPKAFMSPKLSSKIRHRALLLGLASTLCLGVSPSVGGTATSQIPAQTPGNLAQTPTEQTPTTLPAVTRNRVLQRTQALSGLPLDRLTVVAAEPRTWDGCMGLPNPENPVCTMIAISGWRVIARSPQQVWIYHTNQDGSEIRLNTAAGDYSEGQLVPTFLTQPVAVIPRSGALLTLMERERQGITERDITRIEIFQDGRVVRQNLAEGRSPETVRRLSPEEQTSLVNILQANQFTSFEGLRYGDPRQPNQISTTIVTPYRAAVQYDHSIAGQLPLALQRSISTLVGLVTASSLIPSDIAGHLYAEEIRQALLLGLMAGFADGQFRPDYALTREQLAVILAQFIQQVPLANPNEPNATPPQLPPIPNAVTVAPFFDVAPDRWSAARIQYLKDLGLIRGYADNSFRPGVYVTRAELIAALHRTDEYLRQLRFWDGRWSPTGLGPSTLGPQPPIAFTDIDTHWAQPQIFAQSAPCRVAAPTNETGPWFDPNNPALRGYAAAALVRSLQCLSAPPPPRS